MNSYQNSYQNVEMSEEEEEDLITEMTLQFKEFMCDDSAQIDVSTCDEDSLAFIAQKCHLLSDILETPSETPTTTTTPVTINRLYTDMSNVNIDYTPGQKRENVFNEMKEMCNNSNMCSGIIDDVNNQKMYLGNLINEEQNLPEGVLEISNSIEYIKTININYNELEYGGICDYDYDCDSRCETCYNQEMINSWHANQDPRRSDRPTFEREKMCAICKDGFGFRPQLDPNKAETGGVYPFGECDRCHYSCGTCASPENSSHCWSCADGFIEDLVNSSAEIIRGSPVKKCIADMTPQEDTCHPSCNKCFNDRQILQDAITIGYTPPGNLPMKLQCTECPIGKVLEKEEILVDGFENFARYGNCKSCHHTCKTCSGLSETNCTTCKSNSTLIIGTDEFGVETKTCETLKPLECNYTCELYEDYENHFNYYDCNTCIDGYSLMNNRELVNNEYLNNTSSDNSRNIFINDNHRILSNNICVKDDNSDSYDHSNGIFINQSAEHNYLSIDEAYDYCSLDDDCLGFNYYTYYSFDYENFELTNDSKPYEIECDNKFEIHFVNKNDNMNGTNIKMLSSEEKNILRTLEGNENLDVSRLKSALKVKNTRVIPTPTPSPTPTGTPAPTPTGTVEPFTIGSQSNMNNIITHKNKKINTATTSLKTTLKGAIESCNNNNMCKGVDSDFSNIDDVNVLNALLNPDEFNNLDIDKKEQLLNIIKEPRIYKLLISNNSLTNSLMSNAQGSIVYQK